MQTAIAFKPVVARTAGKDKFDGADEDIYRICTIFSMITT